MKIYGYANVAFFNVRADGDESYFASKAERDAAITGTRERAIAHGLSETAARSGIYPITATKTELRAKFGQRGIFIDVDVDL
ncbi:MAG: hypothetical protein ACK52I_01570 [Pseudomonadota bacterium]|jgi:hypothetical protein